jgi:hypothetical protein
MDIDEARRKRKPRAWNPLTGVALAQVSDQCDS